MNLPKKNYVPNFNSNLYGRGYSPLPNVKLAMFPLDEFKPLHVNRSYSKGRFASHAYLPLNRGLKAPILHIGVKLRKN